jgi:two-component system, NarL family, sensor kinase
VSGTKSFARDLRAFWLALAVICLLGVIAAYGITRFRLTELEQAATRDARRLAVEVVQPALSPGDGSRPMRGARYESMLSTIEGRVLLRPIGAVRIWSGDGTIVFADDPKLVGDRMPAMRDDIHDLNAGAVSGFVKGGRFHTLVLLRVAKSPTSLAAELIRSHAPLVEKAKRPWYPWVGRAIRGAIAFAALYVVTWAGLFVYDVLRRRSALRRSRATMKEERSAAAEEDENVPAYVRPGFREELETRQRVERELTSAQAERDELARRLQQAELELERLKATASVSEPA